MDLLIHTADNNRPTSENGDVRCHGQSPRYITSAYYRSTVTSAYTDTPSRVPRRHCHDECHDLKRRRKSGLLAVTVTMRRG